MLKTQCIICRLPFEPRQHNSLTCSAACKHTRKIWRDRQRNRSGRATTEKKREWMRAYWRKNPEKRKEYNKRYYSRRKAAVPTWTEERRQREALRLREYSRQYRARSPAAREKQREYMKAYKHKMRVAYLTLQQILKGEQRDAR